MVGEDDEVPTVQPAADSAYGYARGSGSAKRVHGFSEADGCDALIGVDRRGVVTARVGLRGHMDDTRTAARGDGSTRRRSEGKPLLAGGPQLVGSPERQPGNSRLRCTGVCYREPREVNANCDRS